MARIAIWQRRVQLKFERSSLDVTAAPRAAETVPAADYGGIKRQRLITVGGILGALAVSSCCVFPVILFSVGLSGAWVGSLLALAPYKPFFAAATAGLIAYGFYLVYWKPRQGCANDAACTQPIPNRLVKFALWTAAILATIAFAFDYVALLLFA
jgi:mercuric ion transport protein